MKPMKDLDIDVAILGAGPAGLCAACRCQDEGLSYALLDRAGLGQSFFEYPHALRFFSPPDEMEIGGVPLPVAGGEKPTREQYLAYLRAVVRARDIRLFTWESATAFDRKPDRTLELHTRLEPTDAPGRVIRARAIVLAIGVWARPIPAPIRGADQPHVLTEFLEPTPYCGQDVLVVGGGNSAVGASLSLMEARARVTLSMRRPPKPNRSRLRPFVKRDLDFAVHEGKIHLKAETVVTDIGPLSSTLQPVRYTGTEDLWEGEMSDYEFVGEPFSVPARFVFTLFGHLPDRSFLADVMGLPLRRDGRPEASPETWETPVRNVFAVGSLSHPKIDVVLRLREQAAEVVHRIKDRLSRR